MALKCWSLNVHFFNCCVLFLFLSYFILNKRTGFLIIKENAPPGIYQFQVRVSDGVWPDAVSSVTVHVRELRDEAIYNSGSLRLAGKIDSTETHTHTPVSVSSQKWSVVSLVNVLLDLWSLPSQCRVWVWSGVQTADADCFHSVCCPESLLFHRCRFFNSRSFL